MTDGAERQRPIRVLLLEDSGFDAELLREHLLVAWPGAVLHWVTGRADFAAALDQGPDVVLSDYELPGFSGRDALDLVRARSADLPFIFVSGVIGEDNAVELLKRGATDYVSKSRLSRLPVVVDRALRESRMRAAQAEAEAQLRKADLLHARVVDSLPDHAVILLDAEGRVTAWNRAATTIFGYAADAIAGRSAALLNTPEDVAAGVLARELAQAQAAGKADVGGWLQRADGSRLRAEGVVTPLPGPDGSPGGFCKLVHDATVAYERAEALRRAKEDAERASLAKDRFLGMLSHELRTPLTPIAAAAHVLERFAQVPERYADLLPMIRRNVALESRLIDDLLDLTAVTAGKVRLTLAPVDMHALVHQVLEMLEAQARVKSLDIVLRLAAEHAVVVADGARMHQVLSNILRNAIKFTPEGGRIELGTRNEAGRFLFRCTDTGIGIDAVSLPRIFSAFEQAGEDVARQYGGLGLGLTIAAGMVAEHHGTLTAASDGRDRGATFELGLEAAPFATPAPETRLSASAPTPGTGRHLLLVEDSVDAADALQVMLEDHGYRVTHAGTCAAALSVAAQVRFDAVITDLGLPDGSGIAIGHALSATTPVIALSGYGGAADRRECDEAGFAAHLLKPADPDQLVAALRRVLPGT
jgi:PAS domain S-box-containing protein